MKGYMRGILMGVGSITVVLLGLLVAAALTFQPTTAPTPIPTTPKGDLTIVLPTATLLPTNTPTSIIVPSPQILPTLPIATPTLPSAMLPTPPANVPADALPAQLVEVVDGDTIEVLLDGQAVIIRYIGVDTPEKGQPGYRAAAEANRAILGTGLLYLVKDQTDRDQYGRWLRYVYNADGSLVEAEIVRQGWAQPVEYSPDTRHASELRQLAIVAAQNREGFWAGTSPHDGAMSYGLTTGETNIRKGPGTDFESSGLVAANIPLTIFGRNQARDWVQVRTPDRVGGWMYAPLLVINVDLAAIPISEDVSETSIVAQDAPTLQPTQPPLPQEIASVPVGGGVRIVAVDKRAEFVTLQNEGANAVNLRNWKLISEKGNQEWVVPDDFMLQPGAVVYIHAQRGQNDTNNLYSGFGSDIWNNSEADPAVLLDPSGVEISRY